MADHPLALGDRTEVLADVGGVDVLDEGVAGRVDRRGGDGVGLGVGLVVGEWRSRTKHD